MALAMYSTIRLDTDLAGGCPVNQYEAALSSYQDPTEPLVQHERGITGKLMVHRQMTGAVPDTLQHHRYRLILTRAEIATLRADLGKKLYFMPFYRDEAVPASYREVVLFFQMNDPTMYDPMQDWWRTDIVLIDATGLTVDASWWDPNDEGLCVWAAYQAKSVPDLATSYIDLSGHSRNAGVGVAPTWDEVNGWKFNGASQYLTTTFVPADDQSQSMIMQVTNCVVSSETGMLDNTNGNRFSIRPVTGGFGIEYTNGANAVIIGPTLAAGNVCVAGASGYRDGAAETAALNPPTGPTALTTYIGAAHRLGLIPTIVYMSGYIQAFALYDCILTAPQVLAVATAMAAL